MQITVAESGWVQAPVAAREGEIGEICGRTVIQPHTSSQRDDPVFGAVR